MAEVTVKQLADVVGTPVERLLEQIKDAGLTAENADSIISDADKLQLLDYLRKAHGKVSTSEKAKSKITLKRKTVSELKVGSSGAGRSKTVNVQVKHKRNITRPTPVTTTDDDVAVAEKPKELE